MKCSYCEKTIFDEEPHVLHEDLPFHPMCLYEKCNRDSLTKQ